MVCGGAVCRRVGATVARRALIGNNRLRMVPTGGLPAAGGVATGAIQRRADVAGSLARR